MNGFILNENQTQRISFEILNFISGHLLKVDRGTDRGSLLLFIYSLQLSALLRLIMTVVFRFFKSPNVIHTFALLPQRFCQLKREYAAAYESIFPEQYSTCHRLDTNKLRNVSKMFAHLFYTDGISWTVRRYMWYSMCTLYVPDICVFCVYSMCTRYMCTLCVHYVC